VFPELSGELLTVETGLITIAVFIFWELILCVQANPKDPAEISSATNAAKNDIFLVLDRELNLKLNSSKAVSAAIKIAIVAPTIRRYGVI